MSDARPEQRRFLTFDDVAEELATRAPGDALAQRGELRAITLGGRG